MIKMAENAAATGRLGRLPRRSDRRAIIARDFLKQGPVPKATNFWRGRWPFSLRAFGNLEHGNCTIAKQATAGLRMERLETRQTPKIDDQAVIDTYYALTAQHYGGGDTGAYEIDALNNWRRPDRTFRDTKGRPLTIDAYAQLNPANQHEIRQAIALADARGIAVCANLPAAFIRRDDVWDLPEGQAAIGPWQPGSWGGHSMWAVDYDEEFVYVPTWEILVRVTWRAFAAYFDEAHLVVDSANAWRKRQRTLNIGELVDAVNAVSSVQIPL